MIKTYLYFWAWLVIRIRKPFIIGITGSAGKTTTTEMIAHILSHKDAKNIGLVGYTVNNMNDDVGLPATLLRFNCWEDIPYHRLGKKLMLLFLLPFRVLYLIFWNYPKIMVLEIGIGNTGHMQRAIQLVTPNVAIVTNIGAAHLMRFNTVEGVAQEKGLLVRAVPASGLIILGEGHNYVSTLEKLAKAPVKKVTGEGNALSMNIAVVLCKHLGVSNDIMSVALRHFRNPDGRLNQLKLLNLVVIDDSYNANPLSVKYGLGILSSKIAKLGQRKVAILGIMDELGENSSHYHEEVGNYARNHVDLLVGVGSLSKYYVPDIWFENSEACAHQIGNFIQLDDCVFVKGSGSARMSRIVMQLKEKYS